MTNASGRWSPSNLVISGRFAGSMDLTRAVERLSDAHDHTPVILATFSANSLLPSLSRLHGFGNAQESRAILDGLNEELQEGLGAGGISAVISGCSRIFGDRHGHKPSTATFGKSLNRPGDTMVIIFTSAASGDISGSEHAEYVAACALGSLNAAFHRENVIDLSTTRQVRRASELVHVRVPSVAGELGDIASTLAELQISNLLNMALKTLSAEAIITYDVDEAELQLHHCVGELAEDLIPLRQTINPNVQDPLVPEGGGSHLANLAELANSCISTERRLVGELPGGKRWAIGFPFGSEHAGSRPAGAVCVVLQGPVNSRFESYELTLLRQLATHLARVSGERRWISAVGIVSAHLREISDLGRRDSNTLLIGCSDTLENREDVKLASPIIAKVLSDIADFSGAMSVTCRLLSGTEGPLFDRRLVRMHCVGADCDASPESFSMDDAATCVNTWVAVNGKAVYLRSVSVPGDDDSELRSPDLTRYPGLERPAIFRNSMRSELCVPIFAESKLVGTINLESDVPFAFDVTADVVDEFAQLIGVVLLECRRQISVGTMAEARGFLGRRHELEARLINFGNELERALVGQDAAQESAAHQIQALRRFVYMKQVASVKGDETVRIDHVLRQASESIEWTYKSIDPEVFAIDISDFLRLSELCLSKQCADALLFGVTQALLNVRKYGSATYSWLGWKYPARYHITRRTVGGQDTVYLAIQSTCYIQDIADIDTNCIFRQPIAHPATERTSLGTFLAGEIMRRVGGSANFRVEVPEGSETIRVVTAEFGAIIWESDSDGS